MFSNTVSASGRDLIELIEKLFTNRTGATLNRGDIVAVDLTGSDGDVQAYSAWTLGTHDDNAHPFANVIAVATAHLSGWIFAVCNEDSIANDAKGKFVVQGVCKIEMVGSSAISNGGLLTPTNAQTYASAGDIDTQVNVGIALEAGPTAATAAVKYAIFQGDQLSGAGSA